MIDWLAVFEGTFFCTNRKLMTEDNDMLDINDDDNKDDSIVSKTHML